MSEYSIHTYNRLSILILQDGFSFLVLNEYQTPLVFENFKLEATSSASELLKLLRSKINSQFLNYYGIKELEVIYGNPQFSIVPQEYFEESHLPHYLKYSSKLIEGDDFSYDGIQSIQANTVYIPYININNYLFDEFGSFKFTHLVSGLAENGYEERSISAEYLKIHVCKNQFYLTAFKNQKLQLANAFSFETAEDFAYYVLFSIEELNFNREDLIIDFTGNFYNSENNIAFTILSTYIRHMHFKNKEDLSGFSFKEGFNEHFNLV
ncbi:DUF3822 family protein [Psychroflexus lacisalsi]|jgi:hypothetical protein|uniref:DUF3822 domain-containing protein n=1 Tax=Psychroflexus lacisalsi TaxID=503928 RepID=A0ABP3VQC7_9FLAO|nr:DUF3822 family protein [Psychroflexus lacisalsi]MBZ9620088.1 DUF3822 family protein [Psychroflexus lacisalsi]